MLKIVKTVLTVFLMTHFMSVQIKAHNDDINQVAQETNNHADIENSTFQFPALASADADVDIAIEGVRILVKKYPRAQLPFRLFLHSNIELVHVKIQNSTKKAWILKEANITPSVIPLDDKDRSTVIYSFSDTAVGCGVLGCLCLGPVAVLIGASLLYKKYQLNKLITDYGLMGSVIVEPSGFFSSSTKDIIFFIPKSVQKKSYTLTLFNKDKRRENIQLSFYL